MSEEFRERHNTIPAERILPARQKALKQAALDRGRREARVNALVIMGVCFFVTLAATWVVGIAYVAWHFISKYW
jgi:hypothetical protein